MAEKEYIERKSMCEDLKQMAKYQEPYKQSTILGVVSTIESRKAADVAPRAEVAREIFVEIRNILNKHYYACYQNEDGDECDAVISYLSYVAVDFDRLEQKYTGADPEPPKGDHHE